MIIKLRQDQTECVEACLSNTLGRITLPTGSGKTLIAAEILSRKFKSATAPSSSVIFLPRILLAKQWIKKLGEYLIHQNDLKVNFLNVNSGALSSKIKEKIELALYEVVGAGSKPIITSTSSDDVEKEIQSLHKDGYHVVVICTYHSNETLLNVSHQFDVSIYDESHFVANDSDFFNSTKVSSKSKYFFTATPRTTDSDDGYGMNNVGVYGEEIFNKSPKDMIDIGAIVGPRVHVIGTSTDIQSFDDAPVGHTCYNTIFELLMDAFDKHKEVVKQNSFDANQIGAKLLVVCNGQLPLQGLLNSKYFRDIKSQRPDLQFYGLSSDFGVYVDGKMFNPPVTNSIKEEFLERLYEMKPNDDAIIFHVDMVAEGLDVPGITGMMPLRNLGKTKFLQNLGRATRPHAFDRERIESGKLRAGSYSKYVKPNCYVILPYFFECRDDFATRNVETVIALRSQYDFDPSEHVIIDILNPAQTGPDFDEDKIKRDIRGKVIGSIKEVYHQIETDESDDEEFLFRLKFRDCLANGRMEELLNSMA